MLPTIELPQYELTLPVSNKKIKYRPFVVKEEKNLLIAMQDDNPDVALGMIEAVVRSCTNDVIKSFDDYSQLDMEFLFINIRNKSMGEGVEVQATCPKCGKTTHITIDLSKVGLDKKVDKVNPEVQLDHNLWLIMHYPSLKNTYKLEANSPDEVVLDVMASCIDSIVMGETSYNPKDEPKESVIAWLQNLSKPQFEKVIEYFSNAPKLVYERDYQCASCREINHIKMEGLQDFFD